MRLSVILMILSGVMLFSCHPTGKSAEQKIDGRLMRILEDENRADIPFIGQCRGEIDDELKSRLEQSGIIIESIIGDIFTGKGSREDILQIAGMPEIKTLQAPKKHHPLENK